MNSKPFVKTDTILDKILAQKVVDVAAQQTLISLSEMQRLAAAAPPPRDFIAALRRESTALIAEVKKASPSKGVLLDDFDAVAIGRVYAENGAAAISVLTDKPFFQGDLAYLTGVWQAVDVPVLRKDFVIDAYQVYEARAAYADAVLLIAAALDDEVLAQLHTLILSLGMAALVEVHHEEELARVLKLNPGLIGVNNRDLKTFDVDINTTARLAKYVPSTAVLVAESGIHSAFDVQCMAACGAHAVLVGESLVKAGNIAQKVRELSGQSGG